MPCILADGASKSRQLPAAPIAIGKFDSDGRLFRIRFGFQKVFEIVAVNFGAL